MNSAKRRASLLIFLVFLLVVTFNFYVVRMPEDWFKAVFRSEVNYKTVTLTVGDAILFLLFVIGARVFFLRLWAYVLSLFLGLSMTGLLLLNGQRAGWAILSALLVSLLLAELAYAGLAAEEGRKLSKYETSLLRISRLWNNGGERVRFELPVIFKFKNCTSGAGDILKARVTFYRDVKATSPAIGIRFEDHLLNGNVWSAVPESVKYVVTEAKWYARCQTGVHEDSLSNLSSALDKFSQFGWTIPPKETVSFARKLGIEVLERLEAETKNTAVANEIGRLLDRAKQN